MQLNLFMRKILLQKDHSKHQLSQKSELHLIIMSFFNVSSLKLHLSGRKIFPAILKSLSTGAERQVLQEISLPWMPVLDSCFHQIPKIVMGYCQHLAPLSTGSPRVLWDHQIMDEFYFFRCHKAKNATSLRVHPRRLLWREIIYV